MPDDPSVTVLMPVYNGGDYLKLSIKSILDQTYKDFEFLIINDCSTDNSLETINSFGDSRITVHTNSVNMGQTKSLNIGLRLARGRYIVINDADDLSLPHRIEKQLNFISSHPEYAVVGSSSFIMDRSGKIKRIFKKPLNSQEIIIWILSDTPIIHGSVIMNKEIILANGGYDEEFRICQDYELWSSLTRKGFMIVNIPDLMVVIRHYMDSVSFREKDAQTIENGRIVYANVSALTSLKISHDEAIRQRLFFAATDQLSMEAFAKAKELFIQEYKELNIGLGLSREFVLDDLRKKLMNPYCKLAISKLKTGNINEARRTTYSYMKEYGFSAMPFLIWITSHSGKMLSNKILRYYERWQECSVKLRCVGLQYP